MYHNYCNKEGKGISMEEWARLFGDFEYKTISHITLSNGKRVSTIWLELNHNFRDGTSLIFETMVFSKDKKERELYCERYATLKEAEEGHERIVKEYEKAQELKDDRGDDSAKDENPTPEEE